MPKGTVAMTYDEFQLAVHTNLFIFSRTNGSTYLRMDQEKSVEASL